MDTPECPQKAPYAVEVEKDKRYSWCTCGLSQEQPFCDGSHKETSFRSLPKEPAINLFAMAAINHSNAFTESLRKGKHRQRDRTQNRAQTEG